MPVENETCKMGTGWKRATIKVLIRRWPDGSMSFIHKNVKCELLPKHHVEYIDDEGAPDDAS